MKKINIRYWKIFSLPNELTVNIDRKKEELLGY